MDKQARMEELKDSLDLAQAQGDRKAEAEALYGIGRIYFQDKVFEAADDFWGQCRSVCRESGQRRELAQVLMDLGDMAVIQEDPKSAGDCFQEALNLFRETKLPQREVKIIDRLGDLARQDKELKSALEYYQKGFGLCRTGDDNVGSLYFLDKIILIFKALGAVEDVSRSYREMIGLSEKMGDRARMALDLAGLADVYSKTGRPREAIPYLEMAHDLYLKMDKEKEAELIRKELGRLTSLTGPASGAE